MSRLPSSAVLSENPCPEGSQFPAENEKVQTCQIPQDMLSEIERIIRKEVKISFRHTTSPSYDKDDRMQEGWLGAIGAFRNYDSSLGDWLSYLSFRISGAIKDGGRRLDPYGRTYWRDNVEFEKTSRENPMATEDETCANLGWSQIRIQRFRRLRELSVFSLDELMEEDPTGKIKETVYASNNPYHADEIDTIVEKDVSERLLKSIASLPRINRAVTVLYFFGELSLKDIAKVLGSGKQGKGRLGNSDSFSESRVSLIKKDSLLALRKIW